MPAGRTIGIKPADLVQAIDALPGIDEAELYEAIKADVPGCFGITIDREEDRDTGTVRVTRVLLHTRCSTDPEILKARLRARLAEHKPTPRRRLRDVLDHASPKDKPAILERVVRARFGDTILKDQDV